MRLKDLTKVYVLRPVRKNVDGEYQTKYEKVGVEYLNLQQDFDELDKNSSGEIDYDSLKARTDKPSNILKTYGIALTDKLNPDYIVNKSFKIGRTRTYTLNKVIK